MQEAKPGAVMKTESGQRVDSAMLNPFKLIPQWLFTVISPNFRKGGVSLSIQTISMIALGILIVVLMYVSFDTAVSQLIESFLENLVMKEVDPSG